MAVVNSISVLLCPECERDMETWWLRGSTEASQAEATARVNAAAQAIRDVAAWREEAYRATATIRSFLVLGSPEILRDLLRTLDEAVGDKPEPLRDNEEWAREMADLNETLRDATAALIPLLEGHPDGFGVDDLGPFYTVRKPTDHPNYKGRHDVALDHVVDCVVERMAEMRDGLAMLEAWFCGASSEDERKPENSDFRRAHEWCTAALAGKKTT